VFESNGFCSVFSIFGHLLIALWTGGVKPCISTFGADQFNVNSQVVQLSRFFSLFAWTSNAGNLASTLIAHILRKLIGLGRKHATLLSLDCRLHLFWHQQIIERNYLNNYEIWSLN
jgi:dipeptide/tripeptide permease